MSGWYEMNIEREEHDSSDCARNAKCSITSTLVFGSPVRFIVSLIAVVSAVLGIVQWIDAKRSVPSINAIVTDRQCLARQLNVADLTCSFRYKNKIVNDLWTLKLSVINSCSKNIIGVMGGDLMSSNLCFRISKGFHIVSLDQESDFDLSQVSWTQNEFSISFEKWRPDESRVYRLYCERYLDADFEVLPEIAVVGDPLKQGVVYVENQGVGSVGGDAGKSLLMVLPRWLRQILRWTGLVCYGLFFCVSVFVFFFVMPWIVLLKRLFWKIKYDEQFKRAMGKLESCVPGRGYRGVPADFWDKHNIPPPPINLRFVDDVGTSGPWIYFLLLVFSLIALLALIVV